MSQKRIAIACQGGGSQCAFVAGALKTLFTQEIHHRYEIVGLSGTSGGALTAGLAWYGLLKQARGDGTPIEDRILALWKDLTAQTPQEILFDKISIEGLRLVERGVLPSVARSPSSLQFRFLTELTSRMIGRPEFTDLRALLLKHIDFGALPELVQPDSPVMLVGATDVLEGSFKVFTSTRGEITVDALLASAAIPNLFPAVKVDGHVYWDGIFATNPPIIAFLQKRMIPSLRLPEEIWVIQVNRSKHRSVPELPSDIFDRRNHLAGNLSLRHELQVIDIVNLLLEEGALSDRFRASFGMEAIERIKVRFIRMSSELENTLDYPSKLSRQPTHIARLLADGESQAKMFLADMREAHDLPELPGVQEPRAAEAGASLGRPS
jgi:NTE family protein